MVIGINYWARPEIVKATWNEYFEYFKFSAPRFMEIIGLCQILDKIFSVLGFLHNIWFINYIWLSIYWPSIKYYKYFKLLFVHFLVGITFISLNI